MKYFIVLILVCLIGCGKQKSSGSPNAPLFDLTEYLDELESQWNGKNITKEFSYQDMAKEKESVSFNEWQEAIKIFDKYNINKPDFLDKFNKEVESGKQVFTANHKLPRVRKCVVYGLGDSILVEYETKTIIGRARHILKSDSKHIEVKRFEKYLMSDSTESSLSYRVED